MQQQHTSLMLTEYMPLHPALLGHLHVAYMPSRFRGLDAVSVSGR